MKANKYVRSWLLVAVATVPEEVRGRGFSHAHQTGARAAANRIHFSPAQQERVDVWTARSVSTGPILISYL